MKAVALLLLTLSFPVLTLAQSPATPTAAQSQISSQAESAKPGAGAPVTQTAQPSGLDNLPIVVPRDTLIPVSLMTTINTRSNYVGQAIFCRSIYPITVDNKIIIPEGSSIRGTVAELVRPGRVKGRAKLGLRFDQLVLPNGITRQLRATLAGFGSAGKEQFDPKEGQIKGDRSKKDAEGKVETTTDAGIYVGSIVGIEEGHPGEGVAVGAAAGAATGVIWLLATRNSEIILPQGMTLTVRLSQAVTFDRKEVQPPEPEEAAPRSPYDAGPAMPRRDYGPRK